MVGEGRWDWGCGLGEGWSGCTDESSIKSFEGGGGKGEDYGA